MAEYIERGDIEKWLLTEMASLDVEEDRKYVVERLRNEIPAADVLPVVRGKWEFLFNALDGTPRYGCPICKGLEWRKTNFCPNCGADMREES